jgi:hypothetical protein
MNGADGSQSEEGIAGGDVPRQHCGMIGWGDNFNVAAGGGKGHCQSRR